MKKKPWGDTLLSENTDLVMLPEDLEKEIFINFINHDELVLEIGSGKGDFVITMAKKYPHIHFLAVEMQSMALAYAVRKMQDEDIKNVLFINADATYLFEKFGNKKFKTIFLNHSDPWPKKRHHDRRLTSHIFLKKYDDVFKDEKVIYQKTDNRDLFEYSLISLSTYGYKLEDISLDLHNSNYENIITTEYEKRFVEKGNNIYYLVVKK